MGAISENHGCCSITCMALDSVRSHISRQWTWKLRPCYLHYRRPYGRAESTAEAAFVEFDGVRGSDVYLYYAIPDQPAFVLCLFVCRLDSQCASYCWAESPKCHVVHRHRLRFRSCLSVWLQQLTMLQRLSNQNVSCITISGGSGRYCGQCPCPVKCWHIDT